MENQTSGSKKKMYKSYVNQLKIQKKNFSTLIYWIKILKNSLKKIKNSKVLVTGIEKRWLEIGLSPNKKSWISNRPHKKGCLAVEKDERTPENGGYGGLEHLEQHRSRSTLWTAHWSLCSTPFSPISHQIPKKNPSNQRERVEKGKSPRGLRNTEPRICTQLNYIPFFSFFQFFRIQKKLNDFDQTWFLLILVFHWFKTIRIKEIF